MRVLGAVLAGGKSSRFGSDKALALLDGRMLIEHAIEALGEHAETVIVCGRSWPGLAAIDDQPLGGLGPLAGLNAALRFARGHGFDAVLCAPVDVHPLGEALGLLDGSFCAVLRTQWAVGRWPVALGPALDRHLAGGARSIRSWLEASHARYVDDTHLALRNINMADDLAGASDPGL